MSAATLDAGRVFPFRKAAPDARLRLFCFPFAGGSAALFRPWTALLPPDVELVPVELPARGTRHRERPVDQLDVLAGEIARAMRPLLDRPFAVYGHSLGGLLGFEACRALLRDGGPAPARLVVSGSRAPHVPNPNPPIHHLSDERFLRALERYDGIPRPVLETPELLRLVLPTVRADFVAYERYRYVASAPLPCPIDAFGGADDPWVRRSAIEPWGELTADGFSLTMLAGGHFFLRTQAAVLVGHLGRVLGCGA